VTKVLKVFLSKSQKRVVAKCELEREEVAVKNNEESNAGGTGSCTISGPTPAPVVSQIPTK
jgi:hypothetical protein